MARKKKSAARDFKSPIEVMLRNAIVGAVGDDFRENRGIFKGSILELG